LCQKGSQNREGVGKRGEGGGGVKRTKGEKSSTQKLAICLLIKIRGEALNELLQKWITCILLVLILLRGMTYRRDMTLMAFQANAPSPLPTVGNE
jgi:hypothetical protein